MSEPAPLLTLDDLQALYDEVRGFRNRHGSLGGLAPSGERPSRWHGQGMEVIDSRPYQAGDDIRHMDWRATARSGNPHSRVFQDERQRALFLVIDLRTPMYFASRGELKARRALRCAAMLGLATQARRESVSGVVVTDSALHLHPSTRDPAGIADLVLGQYESAASLPLGPGLLHGCLNRVAPLLPTAASLVILSDLNETLGHERDMLAPLPAVGHRRSCQLIHIQDETEADLPPVGRLRLTGSAGGHPVEIDTRDAALRRRYRERMREHISAVEAACLNAGVRRIPMNTTEPILARIADLIA